METIGFKVDGMHCEKCAARIERLLGKEPGVRKAQASFAAGSVEVRFNPHTVDERRLCRIIEAAGFFVAVPAA